MAEHVEQQRLATDARAWRRWGPYLSERAWGTVREDYSERRRRLGLSSPRPRPLPRLPVERGRPRRHLRRPAAPLLRLRLLERARPDPEGADLRADRPRGQPRRGRQGVLVVPRLHAHALVDALALRLPAGRVPLRAAGRREPARGRLDPEFELLDTGVFDDDRYWDITVDYAKADARRHLHPGAGPQRRARRGARCTCCPRCGSATRGRGASTTAAPTIADKDGALVAEHHEPRPHGAGAGAGQAPPTAVLRQRDRTPRGCGASTGAAVPEGRHRRPRRARRRHRQPRPDGHEGRAAVPRSRWPPAGPAELARCG